MSITQLVVVALKRRKCKVEENSLIYGELKAPELQYFQNVALINSIHKCNRN